MQVPSIGLERLGAAILIFGLTALPAGGAFAQPASGQGAAGTSVAADPGPAETAGQPGGAQPSSEPSFLDLDKATKDGVPVGSFLVNPSLLVTEAYDDNIFATPRNEVSDFITYVEPSLTVKSNWDRHEVNLSTGADIGRYKDRGSEDFEDYYAQGSGRYDITNDSNVFGGASFNHRHESRESPDNVAGTVPTTYDDLQSHIGMSQKLGAFFGRFGGTFQELDFDNVPSATGIINNQDRNRKIYEVGGRFGYEFLPRYRAFVQEAYNWRKYDSTVDDNGFRRNSTGNAVDIGLEYRARGQLTAELYLGYMNQDYRDPRFKALSTADFGGLLDYQLTGATRLTASLDRSVQETIVFGAAGYLVTRGAVQLEHDLQRDLTADLSTSYAEEEFQDIDRTDRVSTFGAGVKYFLLPQVYIGADYQFQRRDSNVAAVNYDENQIFMHLGAQLARGYEEGGEQPQQDQGFYLGLQAGNDEIGTKLSGPRGAGGTLDTEFGDFGASGGIFGGYGATIDHLYLGLEAEADKDSAQWNHARTPGGRVYSVRKDDSYGASARVGYVVDQGSLLYGRLGVARANFYTNYETPSGTFFPQHNTQTGLRYGAGVETPISRHMMLRLDYTRTEYGDYDVTIPSGTDNFDNSENLVRVGVAYRFYDQKTGNQNGAPVPADGYDGPYAGLQVGYGALDSLNKGPRESGSVLVADRASDGPQGGIFGGYGVTCGRVYFGVDVDASAGGEGIGMERDPTGRDYSVNKRATFGASGRIGYVLDPGALVYARVGPVLSEFNTKYAVGTNAVDQNNTMWGLRVGGGVEVPVNDEVFARFDYAYSTYGRYDVNYNSGIDSFDNQESVFQVGAGYRF